MAKNNLLNQIISGAENLAKNPQELNLNSILGNFVVQGVKNAKNTLQQEGVDLHSGIQAQVKQAGGKTLSPDEKDSLARSQQLLMSAGIGAVDAGAGMPQSELDRFNLPQSKLDMYTPSKVADIKDTLANDVPGATWTSKYHNLQPTMKNLEQQIKQAENRDIPISDYQNFGESRLKPLVTAGKLSPLQAKQTVTSWLSRLYSAASDGPSAINTLDENGLHFPKTQEFPTVVNKDTALSMHRANNDAVSTYYNTDGSLKANLSAQDEANLALRNASSDVLEKHAPDINALLQKQSHLYKADNVVGRLATDEQDAALKAAQQPKQGLGGKLGNILKNPIVDVTIGGLLTGGSALGKGIGSGVAVASEGIHNLLDKYAHSPSDQVQSEQEHNGINHGQSISDNGQNVNRYGLDNDPIKTKQLMTTNDYTAQKSALQKQIEGEKLNNPGQANIDQGRLESIDNAWNSQASLRDAWTNPDHGIGNLLTVGNQAYQAVSKADPGFYNALNGGYDQVMTASNGKYAQMARYLHYLQDATGTDFTKFKSKESLVGAIDASMNVVKTQWNTLQQQQTGSTSPAQNPQLKQMLAPAQQDTTQQQTGNYSNFNFSDNSAPIPNYSGNNTLDTIIHAGAQ